MIQSILFSVAFILFVYTIALTTKKDNKKILLHRLAVNHARMIRLYDKLEEIIFLRNYSTYNRRIKTMSYDLYLAGIKKQNDIFDKEMEELRTAKFNSDIERYYLKMLNIHDNQLASLQSEIDQVENTRLLHLPIDNQ